MAFLVPLLLLPFVGALLLAPARPPRPAADAQPLKLVVTVEDQSLTAPFPVRVTLHLHNSGPEAVWLYRHARSEAAMRRVESGMVGASDEPTPAHLTFGGSRLGVHLAPVGAGEVATAAEGAVLESVGLPHPKLVRLGPGEDYEEKAVIQLSPALAPSANATKEIWGRYRCSVTYSARYSNGDETSRNLGVLLWQGEVTSNIIDLDLMPPATAPGSVVGTALTEDSRPLSNVLVSLSDEKERLVAQELTDVEGQFSFAHLPPGLYWVTGRRANATVDAVDYHHVELSAAAPAAAVQLVFLPPEIYEAKKILHKPVLIRVTKSDGQPAAHVGLNVTWSSGTVLDNVRGETGDDGTTALELIPGRNFVALKHKHCHEQEERLNVADGDGVDDFSLRLDCTWN